MSQSTFEVTGTLKVTPPTVGGLQFAAIDLISKRVYPQSDGGSISVNASDVNSHNLLPAPITSVRLLYLRVTAGQSIKLITSSAAGANQAIRVSEEYLWISPKAGDELSSVKLSGAADVEYLIAGDAASPAPPPPTLVNTAIELNSERTIQTGLAGTEDMLFEWRANFDNLPIGSVNMSTQLSADVIVTGGSGTIRVRVGGTPGLATDGPIVLTSLPVVTLTELGLDIAAALAAKPSGGQQVKITGQNAVGQRLTVRGPYLVIAGV